MALIKCPECGKTVSSTATSCPTCGYDVKHRKWYSKKWAKYLIVAVCLFTLISYNRFKNNTVNLVEKINIILEYEILPATRTLKIIEQYENLNIFEKIFVRNIKKIKNKKIESSSDLLKKYLDINIIYTDYKYVETKDILGIKLYKESAYITINTQPKKKFKKDLIETEDLKYNIDLGNGFKLENEEKFETKTNYSQEVKKEGILNNSVTSTQEEPTFELNEIRFKNIEGYIYLK